MTARSALFISPHLDDVAFSCGGLAHLLARCGWATTLCTVFTQSVADPRGFALACQLDKGLSGDVDYLALRRAEDARAAERLQFRYVEWLGLPEAPHRGYDSPEALFGPYAEHDDASRALAELFEKRLDWYDVVFAPQALGRHVDHRRVAEAVASRAGSGLGGALGWYRDVPYALREPAAASPLAVARDAAAAAVALDAQDVDAKLDACAAYASQVPFQFGGELPMRVALRDFPEVIAGDAARVLVAP